MTDDRDLELSIRMRFGTSPYEPTQSQLLVIKERVKDISTQGREPSEEEWVLIVYETCPSAGKYGYHGIDNSDLRTMFQLARRK